MKRIVIQTSEPNLILTDLEGRSFQVHVLPGGKLQLYSLSLAIESPRCPVIIAGEQCGMRAGHEGCHKWAGGD